MKNPNLETLPPNYLFTEVEKRTIKAQRKHPKRALLSLGIGDTVSPLPLTITLPMQMVAGALSTQEGYRGYGPALGLPELRSAIADTLYQGAISQEEIVISDGAKSDLGRLQHLFSKQAPIALQNPTYPVYSDASLLFCGNERQVHALPCTPENAFFPKLDGLPPIKLLFFCSPNNPTGAAATYDQLQDLVAFAKSQGAIILYDAAYASFITDDRPKTIYAVKGAREVAIEIGSFSKMAGFTGLRLGWSVVPAELSFPDGSSVATAWKRIASTLFNGASFLTQIGGIAALSKEGQKAFAVNNKKILENSTLLKASLQKVGARVFGGTHAPYLWVACKQSSWDAFDQLLERLGIITTPGSGFGPAGEHFLRLSAFATRATIEEAAARISQMWINP